MAKRKRSKAENERLTAENERRVAEINRQLDVLECAARNLFMGIWPDLGPTLRDDDAIVAEGSKRFRELTKHDTPHTVKCWKDICGELKIVAPEAITKRFLFDHVIPHATGHYRSMVDNGKQAQEPPRLTEEDNQILMALNDRYPVLVKQEDLAAATDISRRTVGRRLEILRERRLVHRPEGDRKGDTLTDRGRKVLTGR